MQTSKLLRFRQPEPAPAKPNMRRLMFDLIADFTVLALCNPEALLRVVEYVRHHADAYRKP